MTAITQYQEKQNNLNHLKTLAKIASESKQYQDKSEMALLNLMMTAHDMGISPMKAINGGFYIVNGKVCMSTSLMSDRIRKAGHSVKIMAMTSQKCVISATRKDNGDTLNLEYTWEDAAAAGLTNSPTWKKYPKVMLYNRCMSTVARILFPDVVGNTYSEEERFDIQGIKSEDRPIEDPEKEMEVTFIDITEKELLTEEQCAQLDSAIIQCGDEAHIEKLKNHLGVESIYSINPKDFERVMKSLTKKGNSKKQEECHE